MSLDIKTTCHPKRCAFRTSVLGGMKKIPTAGVEPAATWLKARCSTTELRRLWSNSGSKANKLRRLFILSASHDLSNRGGRPFNFRPCLRSCGLGYPCNFQRPHGFENCRDRLNHVLICHPGYTTSVNGWWQNLCRAITYKSENPTKAARLESVPFHLTGAKRANCRALDSSCNIRGCVTLGVLVTSHAPIICTSARLCWTNTEWARRPTALVGVSKEHATVNHKSVLLFTLAVNCHKVPFGGEGLYRRLIG